MEFTYLDAMESPSNRLRGRPLRLPTLRRPRRATPAHLDKATNPSALVTTPLQPQPLTNDVPGPHASSPTFLLTRSRLFTCLGENRSHRAFRGVHHGAFLQAHGLLGRSLQARRRSLINFHVVSQREIERDIDVYLRCGGASSVPIVPSSPCMQGNNPGCRRSLFAPRGKERFVGC